MFEDVMNAMRRTECSYPTLSSMYPVRGSDVLLGHYVEPNTVKYWDECDTEEKYDSNGGHPHYSKTDIVYSINRHGYRSIDLDTPRDGKFVLVVIGCSNTKGVGLPEHEVYVNLLADKIEKYIDQPVLAFNLGQGGTANDKIALRAFSAAKHLKPDYMVVQWTHTNRSVYVAPDNLVYDWWNFYEQELELSGNADHIKRKGQYFEDVQNKWNDAQRILMTARTTGMALSRNRSFGYIQHTMFRGELTTGIDAMFDPNYTITRAAKTSPIRARDHDHMGRLVHVEVADTLMERFQTWWDLKSTQ